MKIAVVIPKYGLVGGAESFAFEVTEKLAAHKDLEFHVFANKWQKGKARVTFHKVPILVFPRFLRQISFAYFSNNQILANNFDLIHSHDRILQMDLLTMHGIPHKTWIREARQKSLSLFDRSMAWIEGRGIKGPHTPCIMPVSTLVKEELLKLYVIPESRIHVIHPGVSANRFYTFDKEICRNEIRQRHGLSSSDVVVLFVGMNFQIKRLELVIRGIADLVKRGGGNPQLKLLVVGKGQRESYMNLAAELGIANRIVFAGVSREVEKYYLASDIFAMPSVFDTFGIAVLEAMMAGLPVIISSRVGAKDIVDSDVQGFVLGKNPSTFDISEKIALLLDIQTRMKMGENARQAALNYTWDKTAEKVVNMYHLRAEENIQNGTCS